MFDDLASFNSAVLNSAMENIKEFTVSRRLFDFLCKDKESKYMTYGSPGVRVYPEDCKRDEIEILEQMNAEQYNEHATRNKRKLTI